MVSAAQRLRSESTPFALRFPAMLAHRVRRDASQARRLVRAGELRPLRELDLPGKRRSDTLFILGSGPSINAMGADAWADIARHDSVGFNFWPLHDVVPRLFVTETPRQEARARALYELLRVRESRYRDVPVLVKMMRPFSAAWLPPAMRERAYIASGLDLPVTNERELTLALRLLDRSRLWGALLRRNLVPFARGTVDYLVMLGFLTGYRRIVLCGIDLNRPEYFFELDARYAAAGLPIPEPPGHVEVHKTFDPDFKPLTVDRVLRVMRDELLGPRGVELQVASAASALHPLLPVYRAA